MRKAYISHKLQRLPQNVVPATFDMIKNKKKAFVIMQSFEDDHYEIFRFDNLAAKAEKLRPWIDQGRIWLRGSKPKINPITQNGEEVKNSSQLTGKIDFGW